MAVVTNVEVSWRGFKTWSRFPFRTERPSSNKMLVQRGVKPTTCSHSSLPGVTKFHTRAFWVLTHTFLVFAVK